MASLFEILIPNFSFPETIENVGAPAPPGSKAIIKDAEGYDRSIEEAFDQAEERVASAKNSGNAGVSS